MLRDVLICTKSGGSLARGLWGVDLLEWKPLDRCVAGMDARRKTGSAQSKSDIWPFGLPDIEEAGTPRTGTLEKPFHGNTNYRC